jgi:starch synthase
VIAVSAASKLDVLAAYPALDPARVHVVHNGIDTALYRPVPETDVLERLGLDLQRPIVSFVGRVTRQKGVPHLLRAARQFDASTQVLLLAGAADTPELAAETDAAVAALRASRDGVVLVPEPLPRDEVRQVLSHSTVFVCPSIYEPLGIVNLEAMACATAVVASDVGGIPEVVADGQTGLLAHYDVAAPDAFEADLAAAVNTLVADPALAAKMGAAGRQRAEREFGWDAAARSTLAIYEALGSAR